MKVTNEVVLLYNINPEKLNKIRFVLLRMGVRNKIITKDMYLQTIGSLAGIKGFEKNQEDYTGEGFTDEMLVMRGFTSKRIDELLRLFRNNNIEKIPLKAILTEHNIQWNSIELYKELKEEHEAMKG